MGCCCVIGVGVGVDVGVVFFRWCKKLCMRSAVAEAFVNL